MGVKIGLEVHVELDTQTKLFCPCSRLEKSTCPICLGHPGTRPLPSRKAVEYALRLAIALQCDVAEMLVFSRKTYYYPDLARGFQITQHEHPIGKDGEIRVGKKKVQLSEVHLEEDPGQVIRKKEYTLLDYGRSGCPLVELVTEPVLTSPKEARAFIQKLIVILRQLKIHDPTTCTIKTDASISIQESGYTRVEIKGIGSHKDVERALQYELVRQRATVRSGGTIQRSTRAWDPAGVTKEIRGKELEEEYGYIPEQDIPVLDIPDGVRADQRMLVGELPDVRAKTYVAEYKIDGKDAQVIADDPWLTQLFEAVADKTDPVRAARWIRREPPRVAHYHKCDSIPYDSEHLIAILDLLERGVITEHVGQHLMEVLAETDIDPVAYVEKEGLLLQGSETICKKVVEQYPDAVRDYLKGEEKSLHFLVGKVMMLSRGSADPKAVVQTLRECIDDLKHTV